MKKLGLAFAGVCLFQLGAAQKMGLSVGAGMTIPTLTLAKIIPATYAETENYITTTTLVGINEVSIYPEFSLPQFSLYYTTKKDLKLYSFFQFSNFYGSLGFSYGGGLSGNPDFSIGYSATDFGLGIQHAFFKKSRIHLLLSASLGYRLFAVGAAGQSNATYNHDLDWDIKYDLSVLDQTMNSLGNFMVAGGGLGIQYKNISMTGTVFHNLTKIDHTKEQYLKSYYGYGACIAYNFDRYVSNSSQTKRGINKYAYRASSKNILSVELTQNLYNGMRSSGETYLTYLEYYSTSSIHFSDSSINYTNTSNNPSPSDLESYGVMHFYDAPKALSFPGLSVTFMHRLTDNVFLQFKLGEEIYFLRYKDAAISSGFFEDDQLNLYYINSSQGIRIENLFSINKNAAYISGSLNEKVRLQSSGFSSAYSAKSAIYNPLYLSANAEFGFKRFQNSLAIGFEKNISAFTTPKINYHINNFYSIYIRFAHYFQL